MSGATVARAAFLDKAVAVIGCDAKLCRMASAWHSIGILATATLHGIAGSLAATAANSNGMGRGGTQQQHSSRTDCSRWQFAAVPQVVLLQWC
jgi:hypothetical protein